MRALLCLAAALGCTAVPAVPPLPAATTAATPAATVWQLATGYRAESFHTQNLQQFAQAVDVTTLGALRIEIHPNNTLVRMADIPAEMQAAHLAAGEIIMSGLAKEVPVAGADSVPFIVASYADAQRLWMHQRPLLDKALAARGLMALYAVPWPSQGLYTTRAVRFPSDFKSSAMRSYNPATVRIAEMLGATPVDVPMPQVGQALAAGRIDSMITSGITGVENKVWDRLKFFYDIRAWFPKNLVLVRRASFDALDGPTQRALLDAARAAEQRGWAASEAAAGAALAELTAHGVRVEPPSFELRTELQRLGERFSIEWVRATGKDASAILIPYYTTALR